MPDPIDPGGGGDPHIVRLDATTFQFGGVPGRLYNLYSSGDLRVLVRIFAVPGSPDLTFISGVDVMIGGVKVVALIDGFLHVLVGGHHVKVETKFCTLDAPGHMGCTTEDPHPLSGVPHCNVTMPGYVAEEASGLVVDGTAEADPSLYEVEEPV